MSNNPLLDIDPTDLVTVTRALIDIPSVSHADKQICDFIEEYVLFLRPDANIERVNNSIVVQIAFDSNDDKPVIFAGHIDTVPPAKVGDSANPSRVDGDDLFGLGAADMKSGVGVMLALLKDIKVKSSFIFYEGEEVADEFNGLFIIEQSRPDLLVGKWAILLEPTDGQLELGCQGCINATIAFNGVSAHSARPYLGVNAIHQAVKTLDQIAEVSRALPEVEIDSLIFKESLQVTTISGGHAENVLPNSVSFNVNFRFLPSRSTEDAKKYLSALCAAADSVDFTSVSAGAMPAYDHPLVELAKSKGIDVKPKIAWTDVSRFYALGITALNCGPGLVEMCHRADEHASIELLNSTYELLKELVDNS